MKYLVLALSKFIKLIILYLNFDSNQIGDIGIKWLGYFISKIFLLT